MLKKTGTYYFLHGFRLILQPGIKRFVIVPLLLNILVLAGVFSVARHFMAGANHWLMQLLPTWLHWLSSVLWLLFIAVFFLLLIYTYVMLANLVAAPFNSLLAEKIALQLTGKPAPTTSWWSTVCDAPRALARQLNIIGYYLPRAVLLGVSFFIPGVHFLTAPLWLLFNAWFMALQYMDYPTDNLRIPLPTVRAQLTNRRWLSLSFGSSVLLASSIPVLNLLTMPAAVAGATELWLTEFAPTDLTSKAQPLTA